MKNSLSAFILLSAIVACSFIPHQGHCVTRTTITGTIKNRAVYPNTKQFTVQIKDFRGKQTTVSGAIKKDGTFRLQFDLYIAQDVNLMPIVGRIFAHPGDNIQVNIDFRRIGQVGFGGDRQKENRELFRYLNIDASSNLYGTQNLARKWTPELYRAYCDSVRNIAMQKQSEFIRNVNPSEDIKRWTAIQISTDYYKELLSFPQRYTESSKGAQEWVGSSNYYNGIEEIESLFDASLMNTDAYELLSIYSPIRIRQLYVPDNGKGTIELLQKLALGCKNEVFRQLLIGNEFYINLNQNIPSFFEKNKELFNTTIRLPFILIPLNNYYTAVKASILNPKTNSDAIFAKMYSASGANLFKTIVKENAGKVIYLDFWSTGCGPCIAEFPNSKKMMDRYAGQAIAFVYICFGTDKTRGEQICTKAGLQGIRYYLNSDQYEVIQKALHINAIPHYTLINKKGEITESGGYLRPLLPETLTKVDALLKEEAITPQ